ncbi:MAG TPA: NmrA family NAD(P)-binding protein [Kofleriaceae bacterium]|nr:NmrA family NAD(P)-binding protein [Kofleriaceae bacterium]
MSSGEKKLIAVVGATGSQGGGVVQALKARGTFAVRAITRKPEGYRADAEEVVAADLTRPETLAGAFRGAYGAFLVTNFWEKSAVSERDQARAAVAAAKEAGVQHLIWSTLPDVHAITGGALHVPHFTDKAAVDADVAAAGFAYHTFVEAPFYFQNLIGALAPLPQPDGSKAWTLPLDPARRCLHVGDITELGRVVAGAFERPAEVGQGAHLAEAAGLVCFDDLLATLREQGHRLGYNRVPAEIFATFFPGADELAAMFQFFEQHTYFGPNAEEKIALGQQIAGAPFTSFADWARHSMPATSGPPVL